jgi:hypothetical protein
MAHRKTHRRRHHSKKKTSRRRTHRRRGGSTRCSSYNEKINNFRDRLPNINSTTYEELYNDVRQAYDEAQRNGCEQEAMEIESFENNELIPKINEIHYRY